MKNITTIASAVAVVAASAQVAALAPADITAARTAGTLVSVDISGASATTQILQDLMVGRCQAGTIAHYQDRDGLSAAGKRYNNYACLSQGVAGLADGTPIMIANQSPGSFEGVGPTVRGEAVEFMNVEGGNCVLNAAGAVNEYHCEIDDDDAAIVDPTNALATSPNRSARWFCDAIPGDTTSSVADQVGVTAGIATVNDLYSFYNTRCTVSKAGVSDEEPAQFTDIVNSPAPITAAEAAALDSATAFAQPFSALVSSVLADELPRTSVQPNGFDYPILPIAVIRAAFATGSTLTASDIAPALTGEQANLVVCRRNLGSGTHVAQNLFYMASPCKAPVSGSQLFDNSDVDVDNAEKLVPAFGAWSGGHVTVGAQGSSDMEECIEDAHDGTMADHLDNFGGADQSFVTDGLALPAIGYQSFGKKDSGQGEGEPDGAGVKWEYVATNGIAPTIENAAGGLYEHYWEATIQWCTDNSFGCYLPTADEISLLSEIRSSAGDTTFIANSGGGAKVLGTSGADVLGADLGDSGVKARFLRFGNSCAEPQLNGTYTPVPALPLP